MRVNTRGLLLACAIILATFAYSLQLRAPFLGTLSDNHHQWLTASTIGFVENWEEDGFWNDAGITMELPKTIDRQYLKDRSPYISYPSGSTIQIYILKQLFSSLPTLTLIQYFDLFNQLAVALVLASIIALSAPAYPYVFATVTAIVYTLHPMPMYWHSVVYFADQAIILHFSLILLLELLIRKREPSKRSRLMILQSIMLAIATSIDWLGVMLTTALGIMRLASPLDKKLSWKYLFYTGLQLGTGPMLVLLIWIKQVYIVDGIGFLRWNFSYRTGSNSFASPLGRFCNIFITPFLRNRFAEVDVAVIYGGFLFCVYRFIRNRKDAAICVSLIAILTCIMMGYFFAQHTYEHDFTCLKFVVPLALIGYGLLPSYAVAALGKKLSHMRLAPILYLFALACTAIIINYKTYSNWKVFFPKPHVYNQDLAEWIRKNATFNDVYVSKDFLIPNVPPQKIALSRHSVYNFANVVELERYMRNTPTDAKFYGIIEANKSAPCGIRQSDIVAKVRSENRDWLFVTLNLDSDLRLKSCLTPEPN